MTKCQYTEIGTCCRCKVCSARLAIAEKIMERGGCDVRDLHDYMRPWVLYLREIADPPRSLSPAGGVSPITNGDDSGPWGENAVGEMEDYDDGTPTL